MGVGASNGAEGAGDPGNQGGSPGRNYVVVSADTHASPGHPRSLPLLRRPGTARGGGRVRRPLVGGHLHVRRRRPRRGRRRRRRAGHGDPAAGRHGRRHRGRRGVAGPLRHGLGRSPPTATADGSPCSRSRASTPRSRFPGPVLAGGLSPAMYLGAPPTRTSRWCGRPCTPTTGGWPSSAPPRPAGGPAASPSTSTTWTGPSRRSPGPGSNGIFGGVMLPAMSVTSGLPGYADDYYEPVVERLRGPRHRGQPAHRRVGLGHRRQAPLRRRARRASSASTRCSCSPAGRCGS